MSFGECRAYRQDSSVDAPQRNRFIRIRVHPTRGAAQPVASVTVVLPDLARTAIEQGIVAFISGTTIWRLLSADAIKPRQHRSWIFPRDPDFATKAAACSTCTPAASARSPYGLTST